MQKINQDTQIYTGSPKDGYFLFLPLQFYYDDEEYTIDTPIESLFSQPYKPHNSYKSVPLIFLFLKIDHSTPTQIPRLTLL